MDLPFVGVQGHQKALENTKALKKIDVFGCLVVHANVAEGLEKLSKAELKYCAANELCFNCGKKGEYSRDYKASQQERKAWRKTLQNKMMGLG